MVPTFSLSLMEPLPRMDIFTPVSSCNLFMEFPRGPSSFPTKLNCNTEEKKKQKTISLLINPSNRCLNKGRNNDKGRAGEIFQRLSVCLWAGWPWARWPLVSLFISGNLTFHSLFIMWEKAACNTSIQMFLHGAEDDSFLQSNLCVQAFAWTVPSLCLFLELRIIHVWHKPITFPRLFQRSVHR